MGNLADDAQLADLAKKPLLLVPASFGIGDRWYVVYTDPGCEFAVHSEFMAQFDLYLPLARSWLKHARHARKGGVWQTCDRPLFRRYMFVALDIDAQPGCISHINDAHGVVELLCNNRMPIRVPDIEIAKLRTAEMRGDFDATKDQFEPGDAAILDHPILGRTCVEIKRQTDRERVEVLLAFLGRANTVSVPIEYLQSV